MNNIQQHNIFSALAVPTARILQSASLSWLLLSQAACFSADEDKVAFLCASDGETCPGGQFCFEGNICVRNEDINPSIDPLAAQTPFSAVLLTGKAIRNSTVQIFANDVLVAEPAVDPDPDPNVALGDFRVILPLQADSTTFRIESISADQPGRTTTDTNARELVVVRDQATLLLQDEAAQQGIDLVIAPQGIAANNMGTTFQDVDNDGDLDLMIASDPNLVVRLNQNGSFVAGPSLDSEVATVFADLDEDGDLDAIASSSAAGAHASVFENLLAQTGEISFEGNEIRFPNAVNSEGVAVIDLDGGGLVDVLFQDGGENRRATNVAAQLGIGGDFPNELEDKTLFLASKLAGNTEGNGSFLAACDFDRDGNVDLAINDAANHQFFMGRGNNEVSRLNGAFFDDLSNRGRSISFAELNGDGIFDLLVSKGGNGLQLIALKRAGQQAAILVQQTLGVNADAIVTGDIDLDGDIDIIAGGQNSADLILFNLGGIQGGVSGNYDVLALNNAGNTEGLAIGDTNNDGALDVFVSDQTQPSRFYTNLFALPNHRSLRVARENNGTLIDVIGATVALFENTAEGPRFFTSRQVDGGSGHGSQDPLRLHFGGVGPRRNYLAEISIPGCPLTQTVLKAGQEIFTFSGPCP